VFRLCDAIERVVGKSLREPVVVWKEGHEWGAHSIRQDQETLIPKEAIVEVWEVRKIEKSLFPTTGRVYVLTHTPKLVFVPPPWWDEEKSQVAPQEAPSQPQAGAV
jgi:hypothetical protein